MYRIMVVAAACAVSTLAQTVIMRSEGAADKDIKQLQVKMGDVLEVGGIGISAIMAGPMTTIVGAPYSAQITTERLQVLADGNRIQQSTSGFVARDSEGRVRREEALPSIAGANAEAPRLVRIEDPVAGVHWTLDAVTKTAIKMPFATMKKGIAGSIVPPPPPGPEKTFFYSSVAPGGQPGTEIVTKIVAPTDTNETKTDLGTQTIEGVRAQGTRATRMIPAGSVGNEQPIVITTETWYSSDLHVLVMSKSNDPRIGETTYKLTNIQRSEPSPSLFQVPGDYTIKDQPTTNLIYQRFDKNQ